MFVCRYSTRLRHLNWMVLGKKLIPQNLSSVRLKHDGQGAVSLRDLDLSNFQLEKIRNFCIVAHIDHGKSTLADRMLEYVGALDPKSGETRVLDKLKVEKERGITVKAQTASLVYRHTDGQDYLLNLMDTPGHVDFSSEVSRSIAACQGAILLVDANQGVQAQTVSNFYMAFSSGLSIIPALNKIDLPNADPEAAMDQLLNLFEIDPSEVILASAKKGIGLTEIFEAVVEKIPPPLHYGKLPNLRCFLQDSWYDTYRGTVNLIQVIDGELKVNDEIQSVATGQSYIVKNLGLLSPEEIPISSVHKGQIAVMSCNMRSAKDAVIGDTFHKKDIPVESLVAVKRPKPMVYAGIFPIDQSHLTKLNSAIEKVCLNDHSVTKQKGSSAALGVGWRLGFLGVLHMEVFTQRLEDEYDANVVVTPPSVPYRIRLRKHCLNSSKYSDRLMDDDGIITVNNPNEWPVETDCETFFEPMVKGTIIVPSEYLSDVTSLCAENRGIQVGIEYIDQLRIKLQVNFPLAEILVKFYDSLKSVSSGYGSFDYEEAGYEEAVLVKVNILINEVAVPELATITHATRAKEYGKRLVTKLHETIPRQQFAIKIQATVGTSSKVLARGDIKPVRKDVTAKCYGGDMSRKMKLLKHQAEGKKRMRMVGKVQLSQDVFRKLLT